MRYASFGANLKLFFEAEEWVKFTRRAGRARTLKKAKQFSVAAFCKRRGAMRI